jgi:hypothetical protein
VPPSQHTGNHVSSCAPFFCACHDPADRGLRSGKAWLCPPVLLSFEFLAQCLGLDEVDKRLPPVDFDHGYQLAVARLESGVAIDPDFYEFKAELGA